MPHEDLKRQAESNAKTIEREIDRLKIGHWNNFRRQYKEFWEHAKEISNLFKTLKPISKEDRERLWERFSSVCDETKRTQNKEREARKNDSRQKRDLVESKIKEAYYQAKGSSSRSDLSKANDLLDEALRWMKDGWTGFNYTTQFFSLSPGKMTKEDHDACWEKWKETKEEIKLKQGEMREQNYNHFLRKAYSAFEKASYEPREAQSMVKAVQGEMKGASMEKWQFDEVRKVLDDAWQKARYKLDEIYAEKRRKHEEWRDRTEGHIRRWEDLIDKNEGVISKIESEIDRLEDMEREARTPEFADRVRGWIEEKHQKLSDIRSFNRELEGRIRSAKGRLN
jgi:hypothetical protein